MDAAGARRLWLVTEPIHALTYFSELAAAAWADAGVPGFWRGYFATRAAPLGAVDAAVVTATFYNFHPSMVERAVPDVWTRISPADALTARLAGMDAALRATVGAMVDDPRLPDVVAVLRTVVDAAGPAGRALFAANAALPWPTEPHLALWHALTCLREHRGDGHNAALLANGIDGCQAHVLAGKAGGSPRDVLQPTRGWSDQDWEQATAGLIARDLLDEDEQLTKYGQWLHVDIETATNERAAAPWSGTSDESIAHVVEVLLPWAHAIHDSGQIRQPNPMGLPVFGLPALDS